MINVSKIKYIRTQLFYDNKKFSLNTPVMICKSDIRKYFNKYELILEILDDDFLRLLMDIEENNKKHCSQDSQYKSNIIRMNNKDYLKLKVPYRYNKYEVNIESDRIYLPTVADIKEGERVKCKINIPKIWHYRNGENYYSGCIMEVSDIMIC